MIPTDNVTPEMAMMEPVILEGLRVKHSELYIHLFMNDWKVEACDEQNLIMHCTSLFHCEVIRTRLLHDIEDIIHNVYGIQPYATITS